jgi:FtsH-binding integral membrane protein
MLALSVVGVLAAKSSGYSLSAVVGLPRSHAQWGNYLVLLAIALVSSFVLFSYFSFYKKSKIASSSLGVLMAFLAVSAIGMTYVVGHSGAESVWKYKYDSIKDQQKLP